MARRIFILRHGQTQFNLEKRLQGHCDSALTPKGLIQARSLGNVLKKHLADCNFKMYSSPLKRALTTAHILCEEMDYAKSQIIEDSRLKEFSFGDWEQRSIQSLIAEQPDLLANKDWLLRAPQAESYESVKSRLLSWLSGIPESFDIVVISHGLTGIVLRGILLDLPYADIWSLAMPQDAFFIIENAQMQQVDCV